MIKITNVKGIPELKAWLETIARGAKGLAARSVTEYVIGMDEGTEAGTHTHGLMHYPAYKYVTMEQAYGGFISDKQRRYVMAMIKEGKIDPGVPHRTGELQSSWGYTGKDTRYTIKNTSPYAQHVMGDQDQSAMHGLIGWRKTSEVIKSNLAGAFRYAQARVREWLKSKGKKFVV